MKRIVLLATIIVCFSTQLFSQQGTTEGRAYMLPDIGAPAMNVYVEFIAHADSTGYFGTSGLIWGANGDDVVIAPLNSADEDKITFSPPMVSWGGRLLSSQAFINPELEPNSDDWEKLTSEFKIPIAVTVTSGGWTRTLALDTFYIVRPTKIGDLSSNLANRLGAGSLGKRSPRGAMVVDSILFRDFTYSVNLIDCDPNTPGNQGYLPFVLLSMGPIRSASGSPATIDVSGTDAGGYETGESGDGGPGGGGGGGRVCDANPGGNYKDGNPGGNGFTGGGGGGRNTGGWPGQSFGLLAAGEATGNDGASLNGLLPGMQYTGGSAGAENAGGGTGHPFGASGLAGTNGNETLNGGYGAGSGFKRDWEGGSGGYATIGTGINSSYGHVHGNNQLVPLAGGSGGASGNPEGNPSLSGNDDCSGGGGGGGGAIRIFATDLEGVQINASGGKGGNEPNEQDYGGSGSGGAVEINAKMHVEDVNVNIQGGFLSSRPRRGDNGGSAGGEGRSRIDRKSDANIAFSPINPQSAFRGPTSDTLTFPDDRIFTLRGSSTGNLRAFLKPESGDWTEITTDLIQINDNWFIDFDFSQEKDLYYYFVLLQRLPNAGQDDKYAAGTDYIFSQAAANVIQFAPGQPEIEGDSTLSLIAVECEGIFVQDTVFLFNLGEAPLDLEIENAYFAVGDGLSIVGVAGTNPVPIDDTVGVIVRYDYVTGHTGTVRDTLFISHNDMDDDENPWKVAIDITFDELSGEVYSVNNSIAPADTIITGVCRGESISGAFRFLNTSIFDYFLDIDADHPNLRFNLAGDSLAPMGVMKRIEFTFDDVNTDKSKDSVLIQVDMYAANCSDLVDSFVLLINIIDVEYTMEEAIDYGTVLIGQRVERVITFTNEDDISVYIDPFTFVSPPYEFVSSDPEFMGQPIVLSPGESMTFTVRFSPENPGGFTDEMIFYVTKVNPFNNESCNDEMSVDLTGNGIELGLVIPDKLDFGTIRSCLKDTMDIKIYSKPDFLLDFNLPKSPEIKGVDAAQFRIISTLPANISYPYQWTIRDTVSKDTVTYRIEFDASIGAPGSKNAFFTLYTSISGADSLIIPLFADSEAADLTLNPIPIETGDVNLFADNEVQLEITNNGSLQELINTIDYDNPNVSIQSGLPLLLGAGETRTITLTVTFFQIGDYEVPFDLLIEQPCEYSFADTIRANVLEAVPEFLTSIDLGKVTVCDDTTFTFSMSNSGEFKYEVGPLQLFNQTDTVFTLNELTNFNPRAVINPGDTVDMVEITFANPGKPGIYTVTLGFAMISNTKYVTGSVSITIEVIGSSLSVTPEPINFDVVVEGMPRQRNVKMSNEGNFDIYINSVSLSNAQEFTLTPQLPPNYLLSPGEFVDFTITLTPQAAFLTYQESLIIDYTYESCDTQKYVEIWGESTDRKILRLVFDDLVAEPDEDNYEIPLKAVIEDAGNYSADVQVSSVTISFNRSLFYPSSVSTGEITSNTTSDNRRYVTVNMLKSMLKVSGDTTDLFRLRGYTMLGDAELTDFAIENAEVDISGAVNDTNLVNGSLRIEICEAGGARLLEFSSPASIEITPNPAESELRISVFALEKGHYAMRLVDQLGMVHKEKGFTTNSASQSIELELSVGELPVGVYVIELVTPSEIKTEKFIINR